LSSTIIGTGLTGIFLVEREQTAQVCTHASCKIGLVIAHISTMHFVGLFLVQGLILYSFLIVL